jgi:hypothetical protein
MRNEVKFIAISIATLLLAAGCSSTAGSISPAKYDKMNCAELNNEVGDTATDISRTAIARGKVANTSVPNWLLGGERVKTAVANRETARIERLQQQQQAVIAKRRQRCAAAP